MMPDWTILDNCRHSGYATAMPWKRLIPLLPLLICDLAIFVDVTAAGIMSPAIPQFAAIFNASEAAMGYAFSAFAATFLVTALPLGLVVERTGRSGLLVSTGMVSIMIGALLLANAGTIWLFVIAQALYGFGSAATWIAGQPLAARVARTSPNKGLGITSMTVATALGIIVGPIIGSISDLSLPFYIYAAMAGITALAAFSLLRGEYEVTETNLRQYAVVIRNSRIQAALLGVMVLFLCVGVIEVMFPIYLSTQGYGKSDMGLLLLISAVGMLLTQPLVARWLSRIGLLIPNMVGLFGSAAVLVAMITGVSYGALLLLFLLNGVFHGIILSGSMMIIDDSSLPGEHALGFAVWNLAFSVGYLVGPALGGTLVGVTREWSTVGGLRAPFLFFALLTLLSIPAFAALKVRGRNQPVNLNNLG